MRTGALGFCARTQAISIVNHLAGELDIQEAMQNVRDVALELLNCEKVRWRRGLAACSVVVNLLVMCPPARSPSF